MAFSPAAMLKFALLGLALTVLSGCETTNRSMGSLQLNFETETLPHDYRERAERLVATRKTLAHQTIAISAPATMVGDTVFSPLRWYVCVSGIAPVGSPPRPGQLGLFDHAERMMTGSVEEPVYDVIVMFRQGHQPFVLDGYDSRLCRNAQFA